MTIAQQLNVTEFPFEIRDKNGNEIYSEYANGDWCKCEYDDQGNKIRYADSNSFWYKWEYDANGIIIYWEDSEGRWNKYEYDERGNQIYYENSKGIILDNRPKQEYTMDEIAKSLGIDVKQLKIKK